MAASHLRNCIIDMSFVFRFLFVLKTITRFLGERWLFRLLILAELLTIKNFL